MTRYELWQAARKFCPQLPSSAVYEFLRGRRAIGSPYLEALLNALELTVVPLAAVGSGSNKGVLRTRSQPAPRRAGSAKTAEGTS
jgi:hypothetical protein